MGKLVSGYIAYQNLSLDFETGRCEGTNQITDYCIKMSAG